MDWLTFVDNLVGHLAWPIVVALLLCLQRKPMGKLIRGLRPTEVEGFGAKLKFAERLKSMDRVVKAAEESATDDAPLSIGHGAAVQVPNAGRGSGGVDSSTVGTSATGLAATAHVIHQQQTRWKRKWIQPAAIVEIAWQGVVSEMRRLLETRGNGSMRNLYASPEETMGALFQQGLVAPVILESILQLFATRNSVNGLAGVEPEHDEAVQYAENAEKIMKILTSYATNDAEPRSGDLPPGT